MRLVAQLRALFTLIMLASYSPLGVAVHRVVEQTATRAVHQVDRARPRPEFRYLGISVFTGRFTRSAAAQQFDPTKAHVSRCPSRYVRRIIADSTKGETRENHR
jgi:hypothetical protein